MSQEQSLGPGTYNTKDFMEVLSEKPSSKKGICEKGEPRFPRGNTFHNQIPGPGSYQSGVEWNVAGKEDEVKGSLHHGSAHQQYLAPMGSGLAPGRYHHRSFVQEVLNKRVSARGPYDLFTGERYATSKLAVRN